MDDLAEDEGAEPLPGPAVKEGDPDFTRRAGVVRCCTASGVVECCRVLNSRRLLLFCRGQTLPELPHRLARDQVLLTRLARLQVPSLDGIEDEPHAELQGLRDIGRRVDLGAEGTGMPCAVRPMRDSPPWSIGR